MVGANCLAEVLPLLLFCENLYTVGFVDRPVRQVLNDHRGFLLVNQPSYIAQEVFRIHPVKSESRRLDLFQDCPERCPSELGLFSQLADQIVLHGGVN